MNRYPTEEELEKIEKWEVNSIEDYREFMYYIHNIWEFSDWGWSTEKDIYFISTGGWSGNEDIIASMKHNRMFWIMYWYQSKRGGHYIFAPSSLESDDIIEAKNKIEEQ